jgi:hypothetical protein
MFNRRGRPWRLQSVCPLPAQLLKTQVRENAASLMGTPHLTARVTAGASAMAGH